MLECVFVAGALMLHVVNDPEAGVKTVHSEWAAVIPLDGTVLARIDALDDDSDYVRFVAHTVAEPVYFNLSKEQYPRFDVKDIYKLCTTGDAW